MAKRIGKAPNSANGAASSGRKSYRVFPKYPNSIFIEEILKKIRETGCPEDIDGLNHNRIPTDARFEIVRPVDIDQRKRPEGDRAPCPMCQPNKFLKGYLVWLEDLKCCAIIGHCCADSEVMHAAQREFKKKRQFDYEESYLLANLPLVQPQLAALKALRPAAEETRRVRRLFKRDTPTVLSHLRRLKVRYFGELILTQETTEQEQKQYVGPARFGNQAPAAREVFIGKMAGLSALEKEFEPVKMIDHMTRQLESLEVVRSEDAALEFICALTADPKRRRAAVAILKSVNRDREKLVEKLRDFGVFFSRENFEALHAYGSHKLNPQPFEAKFHANRGSPRVSITQPGERFHAVISSKVWELDHPWPQPATEIKL